MYIEIIYRLYNKFKQVINFLFWVKNNYDENNQYLTKHFITPTKCGIIYEADLKKK